MFVFHELLDLSTPADQRGNKLGKNALGLIRWNFGYSLVVILYRISKYQTAFQLTNYQSRTIHGSETNVKLLNDARI
jgi:hypothetical protein